MKKKVVSLIVIIIVIGMVGIIAYEKLNSQNEEVVIQDEQEEIVEKPKYPDYQVPTTEELNQCVTNLTYASCAVLPDVNQTIRPMDEGRMLYEYGYSEDYDIPGVFHNGIDVDMYNDGEDYSIYPIAPGMILHVHPVNEVDECFDPHQTNRCEQKNISPTGNHITILHRINGEYITSTYGHLKTKPTNLQAGDFVDVYDELGIMGNTGNSEWDHLHLHTEYWYEGTTQRTFQAGIDPRLIISFPPSKEYFSERLD